MTNTELSTILSSLKTRMKEINYSMIEADVIETIELELELAKLEEQIDRLEYELECSAYDNVNDGFHNYLYE